MKTAAVRGHMSQPRRQVTGPCNEQLMNKAQEQTPTVEREGVTKKTLTTQLSILNSLSTGQQQLLIMLRF